MYAIQIVIPLSNSYILLPLLKALDTLLRPFLSNLFLDIFILLFLLFFLQYISQFLLFLNFFHFLQFIPDSSLSTLLLLYILLSLLFLHFILPSLLILHFSHPTKSHWVRRAYGNVSLASGKKYLRDLPFAFP